MPIKPWRLLFLLMIWVVAPARAQEFAWQGQLEPVTQAGYYRVLLSPQVTGRLQPTLADLRLYQLNGQEVPYLLQPEKPVQYRRLFKPYQMLRYTRIPVQAFSRTDSAATKTTYLRLRFGQPVYPEQVVFHVSAPQLYHRQGKVVLGQEEVRKRRRRKRRRRHWQEISVPLVLHSNAPAMVELPRQQVEELVIKIENEDNPPLKLDSVQVLQLNRYLVAALTPDQAYTLRFGNKAVDAPAYDLAFFQDSLPAEAPVIQVRNIRALNKPQTASAPRSSTLLLWAAIGVVALGLAYMTYRLVQEMNQKQP